MDASSTIELKFHPTNDFVVVVRRFVGDFCERLIPDGEVTARIALAAHELLENVAAYSVDGSAHLAIAVDVSSDGGPKIAIRIRNQTSLENVSNVQQILSEISAATDPFAFYVQRIQQTARRARGSGLGLARIRAEAEMTLRAYADGGLLTIEGEIRA